MRKQIGENESLREEKAREKLRSLEELLPVASKRVHDEFFRLSQQMVDTAKSIHALNQLLPGKRGSAILNTDKFTQKYTPHENKKKSNLPHVTTVVQAMSRIPKSSTNTNTNTNTNKPGMFSKFFL